jgi:hypothetical protein
MKNITLPAGAIVKLAGFPVRLLGAVAAESSVPVGAENADFSARDREASTENGSSLPESVPREVV